MSNQNRNSVLSDSSFSKKREINLSTKEVSDKSPITPNTSDSNRRVKLIILEY